MLAATARGEERAREGAAGATPSGQVVTLADVEGAKIHTRLVTDMLARREGQQGPVKMEADWNITIEPEGKIAWSYRPTTHTFRGTRAGQKLARESTLGESWYTPNGEAVWQFDEGKLTFVRSFNGGATRLIVALGRDGQKLTCTAANAFAREQGKGSLVVNSPIDGAPVTILNWKQVSSSCEVTQ